MRLLRFALLAGEEPAAVLVHLRTLRAFALWHAGEARAHQGDQLLMVHVARRGDDRILRHIVGIVERTAVVMRVRGHQLARSQYRPA